MIESLALALDELAVEGDFLFGFWAGLAFRLAELLLEPAEIGLEIAESGAGEGLDETGELAGLGGDPGELIVKRPPGAGERF